MILEIVLSLIYISDRHNEKWIWKTGCSTTNWIAQYEKVSPILGLAGLRSFFNFNLLVKLLSVQFICLVVSDSLQPSGLQHTRPPCPSPTPGVYSNSMSIELVMPSNHLILCRPLLLPPSTFPSIRVFSNESVLHIRSPKYWHFSFNISPSSASSRLISFRMDWLDLLQSKGL